MTGAQSNGEFRERVFTPEDFAVQPQPTDLAAQLRGAAYRLSDVEPVLHGRSLVKGWLPETGLSVLVAPAGVGKTFMALDVGLHVAAGEDWHGHRVRQGLVVYLIGEAGGAGFQNRLEAFKKKQPATAKKADDHFVVQPTPIDLHGPTNAPVIIQWLRSLPSMPVLVVVDTLARAMGAGDENTSKDMGAFVRNLDLIANATGGHVMVVHHLGKDQDRGARGSSALRAAIDTEIRVSGADGIRRAVINKQRDGPTGGSFSYKLEIVELGLDEEGAAVTSCTVAPCAPTDAAPAKLSGDRKKYLEAFRQYREDFGQPNPGGTGWPEPGSRVMVNHKDFVEWARGKSGAKRDVDQRRAARQNVDTLVAEGVLQINQGFLWEVAAGK